MKRPTARHPKVFDLCEALKCGRPTALGYLDLLWLFASEYAPQGDVGKFTDKRIEAACDWKRSGGVLVKALVSAGWLDRHPEHRLLIHDWHEHAEEWVRKKLMRSGLSFLTLTPESLPTDSGVTRGLTETNSIVTPDLPPTDSVVTPEWVPTDAKNTNTDPQSNHNHTAKVTEQRQTMSALEDKNVCLPKPCLSLSLNHKPLPTTAANHPEVPCRFEEVWQKWPRKVGKDAAAMDWLSVVTPETEDAAVACAERYLASQEVAERKVRNLGSTMQKTGWIVDCARDNWECEWPSVQPRDRQQEESDLWSRA